MIHVLTGTNDFLIKSELSKVVDAFVSEHGDLAVEKFDADEADLSAIKGAVESSTFLSEKKLVVLSHIGINKGLLEGLSDLINGVSETTDLVIVEHRPDRRTAWYKTLQKQPGFKLFDEMSASSLGAWLVSVANDRGAELSRSDADYLVARVGLDQQLLASEIEKLILAGPTISRELIDEMTQQGLFSTIFELLDAAFAGRSVEALGLYDQQRRSGVEAQAILPMIIWQLHILAVVVTAGSKPPSEISRESGISPYSIGKTREIAKNIGFDRLKQLVRLVRSIDVQLKTKPIDPDEALRYLIVGISIP